MAARARGAVTRVVEQVRDAVSGGGDNGGNGGNGGGTGSGGGYTGGGGPL